MDERTTLKISKDTKSELDKIKGKSINDKIKYLLSLNDKDSKGASEHELTTKGINVKLDLIIGKLQIEDTFITTIQKECLSNIREQINSLNKKN